MILPAIRGVIRRRILVNYRVDPELIQRQLPAPFRPKLLGDAAVAGICLIRLEQIRPRLLPAAIGLASENAAHRVAVCWTNAVGVEEEGVYIMRRDSSSLVNHLAGGKLFPGVYHRAAFDIRDVSGNIDFSMRSVDGEVALELRAIAGKQLPPTSRFASMKAASTFFEKGALGYADSAKRGRLDGMYLVTKSWNVEPLDVSHVRSSFFANTEHFPTGSVELDCALVMRNIEHEWHQAPRLASP